MRLLADSQIPFVEDFFAPHCEIQTFEGQAPTGEQLQWAEILLIRSITKLPAAEFPHLKFLGTATIGTDHLDLPGLKKSGIPWAHAPGCNANAVADWVWMQLLLWADKDQRDLPSLTLGIVGLGNTGSLVAKRAANFGLKVLFNDPPKALLDPDFHSLELNELLPLVDILSLQAPLIKLGPHLTPGLINDSNLPLLKKGALILNTGRGEVIEPTALLKAKGNHPLILDVFPGEPQPQREILRACYACSPHIAGYSQEGKHRASEMLYQAIAQHFNWPKKPQPPSQILPPPPPFSWGGQTLAEGLEELFHFQALSDELQNGQNFAQLRKGYTLRRELKNLILEDVEDLNLAGLLKKLGFKISEPPGQSL